MRDHHPDGTSQGVRWSSSHRARPSGALGSTGMRSDLTSSASLPVCGESCGESHFSAGSSSKHVGHTQCDSQALPQYTIDSARSCSGVKARCRKLARDYGLPTARRGIAEVLDTPHIDFCMILSPSRHSIELRTEQTSQPRSTLRAEDGPQLR